MNHVDHFTENEMKKKCKYMYIKEELVWNASTLSKIVRRQKLVNYNIQCMLLNAFKGDIN